MSINVVHVSPTPLVAAPAKLALAQRASGITSTSVILADYPQASPLAAKFTNGALVLQNADGHVVDIVEEEVANADVIHIHNDLPTDRIDWLRTRNSRCAFVYQVHSPQREGPLYACRATNLGLPFRAHLAVAQYQPRHYPTYTPVPNLVLDSASVERRTEGQRLRVLFSPSHTRAGRWNAKFSERMETVLRSLQAIRKIDLVWPTKPLHPSELMALRRKCHVSIDEIVTGAFHQVSLEGLCAGNVVINRADYFSKAMLACCTPDGVMPPFVYADEHTVQDVLLDLAMNPEKTAELQQTSFEFFASQLDTPKLVKRYLDVYERVV
jgi:hypothetical protein